MQSHQTIRLQRGAHRSQEEGACVVELASILAGENFSDRPRAVSPVLTRFLRVYNDWLDDDRRQDLYAYAARIVGTRGPRRVERRRAAICRDWMLARGLAMPLPMRILPGPGAGALAARHIAYMESPDPHGHALPLLDELIACGGVPAAPADAAELEALTPQT
jgi:hypothetical protein